MERYRAIPQGYMTIGDIAKRMGVTVRTLQYYDREGVLPATSESEGGRRLYTYIVFLCNRKVHGRAACFGQNGETVLSCYRKVHGRAICFEQSGETALFCVSHIKCLCSDDQGFN